jgi:hypothetical protein
MPRVWATKKGPLRCTTALFSGYWAVFASKSAVSQRSGANTTKIWRRKKRCYATLFWAKSVVAHRCCTSWPGGVFSQPWLTFPPQKKKNWDTKPGRGQTPKPALVCGGTNAKIGDNMSRSSWCLPWMGVGSPLLESCQLINQAPHV